MFLALQRRTSPPVSTGPLIPTLRLLSGGGAPKPPEIFFEVKREMGIPIATATG